MPAEDSNPLAGIPEVGEVLAGRYRIEGVLGVGGMGIVVEATHLQLGEKVAIKFLKNDDFEDENRIARFTREAWAAAKIKSDHVAKVTDIANLDGGRPYLVMEHLDGQDLGAVLDDGSLSLTTAVDYLLQAGEAIAEAHKLGIVHRDLKPENLFLTRRADGSPWIKVLDFGISKFTGGTITNTATLMGSPLYMAPEQLASAKHVDARADLWALGVILFEMLSGEVPFAGETLPQICTSVMHGKPTRLQEVARHLPDALDAAVMRCLAKDPADRFATVGALADAIAQYGTASAKQSAEYIRRVEATGPSSRTGDVPGSVPSSPAHAATMQSEDSWDADLESRAKTVRQDASKKGAHRRPGVVTAEPVSTLATHNPRGPWNRVVGGAVLGMILTGGVFLLVLTPGEPESLEKADAATPANASVRASGASIVESGDVVIDPIGAPTAATPVAPPPSAQASATASASAAPRVTAAPPSPPVRRPKRPDPWQGR